MQPVGPIADVYVYSLSGGKLTFRYVCPPNAICGDDPFLEYTRVEAN